MKSFLAAVLVACAAQRTVPKEDVPPPGDQREDPEQTEKRWSIEEGRVRRERERHAAEHRRVEVATAAERSCADLLQAERAVCPLDLRSGLERVDEIDGGVRLTFLTTAIDAPRLARLSACQEAIGRRLPATEPVCPLWSPDVRTRVTPDPGNDRVLLDVTATRPEDVPVLRDRVRTLVGQPRR